MQNATSPLDQRLEGKRNPQRRRTAFDAVAKESRWTRCRRPSRVCPQGITSIQRSMGRRHNPIARPDSSSPLPARRLPCRLAATGPARHRLRSRRSRSSFPKRIRCGDDLPGSEPRRTVCPLLPASIAASCSNSGVLSRRCANRGRRRKDRSRLRRSDSRPSTQQSSLSPMRYSVLGSTTGSDFISTSCTSEKIAVLAPMPSATVRMTVRANPGDLRNCRKAKRISFIGGSLRAPSVGSRYAATVAIVQLTHSRGTCQPQGAVFRSSMARSAHIRTVMADEQESVDQSACVRTRLGTRQWTEERSCRNRSRRGGIIVA